MGVLSTLGLRKFLPYPRVISTLALVEKSHGWGLVVVAVDKQGVDVGLVAGGAVGVPFGFDQVLVL